MVHPLCWGRVVAPVLRNSVLRTLRNPALRALHNLRGGLCGLVLAGLMALAAVGLTTVGLAPAARAQALQDYDLRSAAFQLPANWALTYSTRDQEYDFASPDGRFTLWARWWFPDEPLLGFPDVVGHETRALAGQEALVIHIESGSERMLTVAFPAPDAEGEQFLFQLMAPPSVPLADHRAMLEQLLGGLQVNDLPALGGPVPAAPGATAALMPSVPVPPPPGAVGDAPGAVGVPQPPAAQIPPPPPAPTPSTIAAPGLPVAVPPPPPTAPTQAAPMGARYTDPAGEFSLPLPQGWISYAAEAAGLRQVTVLSPTRDALVLAVLTRPEGGRSARQVLEDFVALLYRDALVLKSIEDEAWVQIAGQEVHAVETIAKVYAINSIALPYPRGRVWVYRVPHPEAAFLLVTVRGLEAPADQAATLAAIAEGFLPTAGTPAAATAPAVTAPAVTAPTAPAPTPGLAPGATTPGLSRAEPGVLFDGRSMVGLLPLAFNGAEFATAAQLTPQGLQIAFAEKMGWAKAGIVATEQPVTLPGPDQAVRLRAEIDGAGTNALTLALMPAGQASEDPWDKHSLQLQFIDLGEGLGKVILQVAARTEKYEARFLWPKGPDTFDVLIRPDRVVEIRNAAGDALAELGYGADLGAEPLVVQALLPVESKNQPASLMLRRLLLDLTDFTAPPDLDAWVDAPTGEIALFDGRGLGRLWAGNARRGSQYDSFARFEGGALRLGWTPEDKGSYAGIVSPEAMVWLDGLRGVAEARIAVTLDPAASGDFEISLAGRFTLPGNLSDNDSYVLRFTRQPDGTFQALSALRARPKEGVLTEGLAALPERVDLVLRAGQLHVEAPGLNPDPLALPFVSEGAGLRIAVHAMADAEGRGALALRGITRAQTPAQMPAQTPALAASADTDATAPQVPPLPQRVLFTPPMGPGWQGHSEGKANFAALAMAGPTGLTLSRRDPVPDWNRIAMIGPDPALALDHRLEVTPYQITLALDHDDALGMRFYLSDAPDRFADSARAVLTARVLPDGPQAGGLELRLHTGHFSYDHWRRVLPAGWWQGQWSGRLGLRFGPDTITVMVDDRPAMVGRTAVSRIGATLYPAVVPGGMAKTDPGRVTLRAITAAWVAPEGMTASTREALLDIAEFNPDAFLDFLNAEVRKDMP